MTTETNRWLLELEERGASEVARALSNVEQSSEGVAKALADVKKPLKDLGDIKKLKRLMGETSDEGEKVSKTFKPGGPLFSGFGQFNVVAAAVTQNVQNVIGALRGAFDLAQEALAFAQLGAEAQLVADGFERLGGTVEVLEDLQRASGGLVDDTTLQGVFRLGAEYDLTAEQIQAATAKMTLFAVESNNISNLTGELAEGIKGLGKGEGGGFERLGYTVAQVTDKARELHPEFDKLTESSKTLAKQEAALALLMSEDLPGALDESVLGAFQVQTAFDNLASDMQVAAFEVLDTSGAFDWLNGTLEMSRDWFSENADEIRGSLVLALEELSDQTGETSMSGDVLLGVFRALPGFVQAAAGGVELFSGALKGAMGMLIGFGGAVATGVLKPLEWLLAAAHDLSNFLDGEDGAWTADLLAAEEAVASMGDATFKAYEEGVKLLAEGMGDSADGWANLDEGLARAEEAYYGVSDAAADASGAVDELALSVDDAADILGRAKAARKEDLGLGGPKDLERAKKAGKEMGEKYSTAFRLGLYDTQVDEYLTLGGRLGEDLLEGLRGVWLSGDGFANLTDDMQAAGAALGEALKAGFETGVDFLMSEDVQQRILMDDLGVLGEQMQVAFEPLRDFTNSLDEVNPILEAFVNLSANAANVLPALADNVIAIKDAQLEGEEAFFAYADAGLSAISGLAQGVIKDQKAQADLEAALSFARAIFAGAEALLFQRYELFGAAASYAISGGMYAAIAGGAGGSSSSRGRGAAAGASRGGASRRPPRSDFSSRGGSGSASREVSQVTQNYISVQGVLTTHESVDAVYGLLGGSDARQRGHTIPRDRVGPRRRPGL